MMRRSEGERVSATPKNIRHLGMGILTGVVACVLLLLLASFGVSLGFLPEGAVKSVTLACCLLGAVIGSFMFSRRTGSRFLLNGLMFAGAYFVVLYMLGALLFLRFIPQGGAGSILLSALIGGVLGGVFGAGAKKRRR